MAVLSISFTKLVLAGLFRYSTLLFRQQMNVSTPKTNIVAKDGAALPLLNPALTGRGQGWGLYIIHSQDVRDPTPTPPLEGRGAAAHCFWVVF